MTRHHEITPRARPDWVAGDTIVTDSGLETWLVFHHGIDLPAFAAYPLVEDETCRALLVEYYRRHVEIARANDMGVLLEAPTWRANPDWAATLGHDLEQLGASIDAGVRLVRAMGDGWAGPRPFVVGGTVGPRGDGYEPGHLMDAQAAERYHSFQVRRLAEAGVDVVSALTIGSVDEAIGIVRAADAVGVPVVISFTLETDGRLPSGMALSEAIESTDRATDAGPVHYMINCAHPTHFDHVFDGGRWTERIGGLRANASRRSHAELDEMVELDEGDPDELAQAYLALQAVLPALTVVGGCCGTDDRHVAAIARARRDDPGPHPTVG
ncbi:MAG: homocysteine S-methyltransferase family protein [Acidimicrobiales bacterium]